MTFFNTTFSVPIEIDLWISEDSIQVFTGEDNEPSVEFSLKEMITREILAHAIPATAGTLDDIDAISPEHSLEKLEHTLVDCLTLVRTALNKNEE